MEEIEIVIPSMFTKIISHMKNNQIVKTKEDLRPLYSAGNKFKIIKINTDENLMPIEAISLKTKEIYGFEEKELENL